LVLIQRVAASGGNVVSVPQSSLNYGSAFSPDSQQVWLNALWLVSLGLTLSVALVTGLIKQWINYYIQDVSGTPRYRALIRQFRYMGLSKYGVSPIIELMSILMNVSLFLFFAGLILFSEQLTGTASITWTLVAMTCIVFLFYLGTSLMPLFIPQCPYKTSVSSITQFLILGFPIKFRFPSFRDVVKFCLQLPRHVKFCFQLCTQVIKLCSRLCTQVIELCSCLCTRAIKLCSQSCAQVVKFIQSLKHAINHSSESDSGDSSDSDSEDSPNYDSKEPPDSDSEDSSSTHNTRMTRGSGMKGAEAKYIKHHQDFMEIQAIRELVQISGRSVGPAQTPILGLLSRIKFPFPRV